MTKKYCDRCGDEVNGNFEVVHIPDRHISNKWHDKELCSGCMKKLEHWLLPLPVAAEGGGR